MHVPTIVSVLALAAAAVNAVPNAGIADDGVVKKRQVNNIIQLFDKPCFQNLIFQGSAKLGRCRNLSGSAANRAESGKAKQGLRCTIFENSNCQGASYTLIGDDPKFCRLRNKASSWKCVKD
ncbi:hypothetical protein MRS44_017160 [Fusarium solani]|uniref:Antifungal protein n=1 Tax=Fusarium solani TaxID=169388 RepID=A0A9P9GQD1_FUSSL|nr:uncharacterized protein B0J15DRAFT_552661 [Fusarium solani]KAH7243799.1 hypothetical protein B0J15DRAFT_552661 [Fusarium solani]KAJ3455678.1 hypothetical protein MRS44_017160 [Fusarium solani]